MKNFFSGLKTSLNTIFPGASFSDETTESEVLDFLGTQEGETIKAVQELKVDAAAGAEDISKLTEAIGALTEVQAAQQELIKSVQGEVQKVQTSINAVSAKLVAPKDIAGGDEPPAQPKQNGNTFSTESRANDIMKAAKVLLNQG